MISKKLLYLSEPRQATWLELFFDLIFVVALGNLTHMLAHAHHGHLDSGVWYYFILGFIPMWWIWVGHTVFNNRFDEDARKHRVVTLVLMFLIMLASIQIGEGITHNHVPFVLVYCLARLIISGLYFAAAQKHKDKASFAKKTGTTYLVGVLICASAVFFDLQVAVVIFYLGILFDMVARKFIIGRSIPVDRDHLVERIGLLAIILLGESVISISNSLGDLTWDHLTVATAVCGFVFICMIWWMYFDSFPLLIESKLDIDGDAILYSQLSTYISFAILANMIRHAILDDLSMHDFRIMVIVGMAMFYLGKQTAYYVNRPEYRIHIFINTIAMFVIAGLSVTLLPTPQYILFGAAFSKIVYIAMNYRTQIKLYGHAHL